MTAAALSKGENEFYLRERNFDGRIRHGRLAADDDLDFRSMKDVARFLAADPPVKDPQAVAA